MPTPTTNNPGRVFVASLPTRWDAATKSNVPTLDLNPALVFGELHILTRGQKSIGDMETAVATIKEAAIDFTPEDYILMVGDPILNAALVTAIVMNADIQQDLVRCLRWDRRNRSYEVISVAVN